MRKMMVNPANTSYLCVLTLLMCGVVYTEDHFTILSPVVDGSTEAVLLLIPGEFIKPDSYIMLGAAIQSASPLRLWVAVIGPFLLDIPSHEEASLYINEALASLQEKGADTKYVIAAGHGMGGHVGENWAVDWPKNATALIIMANKPNIVDPMYFNHLPYMLISGDLDGIRNVTSVWADYKQLESSLSLHPENVFFRPVVVLEDVNHQHFSSGTPSTFMLDHDILSPIGYDEAHMAIATHVSAFLTVVLWEPSNNVETAKAVLEEAHINTGAMFKAISEMADLTGGNGRSEWSEQSQRIMAALMDSYQDKLLVEDMAQYALGLIGGFPPMNLTDDGQANITTLTYINQPFNPMDNHTVLELAVKLKSQEAVKELLGPLGVEFAEPTTCKDINQVAINVAIAAASPTVQDRFVSRGHPITLLADDVKLSGPGWYMASLHYNLTEEGLFIQSPSLPTDVDIILGFGGMHYCWLLPPLRALEYIMVDALRHTEP